MKTDSDTIGNSIDRIIDVDVWKATQRNGEKMCVFRLDMGQYLETRVAALQREALRDYGNKNRQNL